jgi:ferredoxin
MSARPASAAAPPQRAEPSAGVRLRVNPIACEAHGLCAELLPERVRLDDWGYPILDDRPLTPALVAHARRAAAACPTLALLLERERSSNS